MYLSTNLRFLQQEENMFLACPPEIARTLPATIQELIGYFAERGGGIDGGLPPNTALAEGYDVMRPRM